MSGTTDIVVAAGVLGGVYWLAQRRSDEGDAHARRFLDHAVEQANALIDEAHAARVSESSPKPAPSSSSPSSPVPSAAPTAVVPTAPAAPKPAVPPSAPAKPAPAAPAGKPATSPTPPPPPKASPPTSAPSGRPIMTAPPPTTAPKIIGPTQPISRAFDPLFLAFGPTLPASYLRALAAHESDMHPDAGSGPGRGLFSIVDVVLADFNERHHTHFVVADLFKPVVNVQIGADTLGRIVDSYAKNHPDVPNLREDWNHPRFVELVTFGWNAGFSERGGVGRVAAFLARQGRRDLTIDIVAANAAAAGATAHLTNPNKARYCRDVVATYLRERDRDAHDGLLTTPMAPTQPTSSPPIAIAAAPMGPAPVHLPT